METFSILRSVDRDIDGVPGDFDEPGKINQTDFMERHYVFNLPVNRFACLIGRNVASFRRDFKKLFNTTPQKWLTAKRPNLAYYEIMEKQRKPIDVFLEAGFENLSHFSYAFKISSGIRRDC